MHDKITILLIDDNPESLQLNVAVDGKDTFLPCIATAELAPYFEVMWLATIGEAREFRDAFLAVSSAAPETIGRLKVVPEILIFDYALSGIDVPVKGRPRVGDHGYQKISPLPRLDQALEALDFEPMHMLGDRPRLDYLEGEPSRSPGVRGKQADNYGCYAGGLLLAAFFGYPCACVPSTRWGKEKTEGTEAAIFEWLLKRDSGGAFEAKGRTTPKWNELIRFAVPLLRKRIAELHDTNLITLSLDDLFRLSEGYSVDGLRMWSRYGAKSLPVDGLFIEEPNSAKRAKAITDWAAARLDSLAQKIRPGVSLSDVKRQFEQARSLADKVWGFFEESDLPLRRWRFHELAVKVSRNIITEEEKKEHEAERDFWLAPSTEDCKSETSIWTFAGDESDSGWVIRWAVLFLVLRLHEWRDRASSNYLQIFGSFGPDARRLGLGRQVTVDDVWRVLYPVPGGKPQIETLSTTRTRDLTRLGSKDRPAFPSLPNGKKDNNNDNLALRIEHILNGEPWMADSDIERSDWKYGLIRGEKYLFRSYALEHFRKDDARPFLKAILH